MLSQPKTSTPIYNHAIVIGGSIAGLLTARVLTNHFARVTIIERDALPDTPEFRKGAPQARHAHGLLARGQEIMEQLFPGLTEELFAAGALPTNMGREMAFHVCGQWVTSFQSAIVSTACSRALLENSIYRRLHTSPQVTFLQQQDVVGLCTDATKSHVTGVRVRDRNQLTLPEVELRADLVVDASGRDSRTPQWLTDLGYGAPEEIIVDAKPGYATRLYRRPAHLNVAWKVMYSLPMAPQQSRGGIIIPMEGDLWQVTLVGLNGDYPPTDEAGFMEFARSLPAPEFAAALQQAEPRTAPYGYRRAENRLRPYDKLPRYLEGLLVAGDAVYAFNPVYGQGMTVVALGSLALDECLQRQRRGAPTGDLTGLAQRFQKQLGGIIAGPWQMATGQDLRWPVTQGAQPDRISRFIQRYFDQVLAVMPDNPQVAEAFFHVQNMLKPPTSLFHPRILWQVWRSPRRQTTTSEPVYSSNRTQPAAAAG